MEYICFRFAPNQTYSSGMERIAMDLFASFVLIQLQFNIVFVLLSKIYTDNPRGASSMHNNVKTPLRISSSWVKLLPRSERPMSNVVEMIMNRKAATNFGEVAENLTSPYRFYQSSTHK